MAKYWLINSVLLASGKKLPGDLIDDVSDNVPQIQAAGGVLWPFADSIVADAAAKAQVARLGRAVNEQDLFNSMNAACQDSTKLSGSNKSPNVSQATWYIKPVGGNDNASGKTANSAIKTWAELLRRLGPAGTVLSPNNPTYAPWDPSIFTGNVGNIYLLGDLPDTDIVRWQYTMATDCRFVIWGTKKPVFAGTRTIDSVGLPRDTATNTPWTITDADTDFWPLKGLMVEIMGGPGAGSRGYVARPYTDKITVAVPQSIGEGYSIAAVTPAFGGQAGEIYVEAAALTANSVALLISAELTARGFANTVAGAVITLTVAQPTVFPLSENTTMTASTAHIHEWTNGETPDDFGYGSYNLPSDPPDVGSTYRVLDFSRIVPSIVESNGDELNTNGSLTFRYLKLTGLANPSGGSSYMQFKNNQFAQLIFGDCMFDAFAVDWFADGAIEAINCQFGMYEALYTWGTGSNLHTCLLQSKAPTSYPSGGINPRGEYTTVDGYTTFVGIPGPWNYGAPDINGAGIVFLGDVSWWDCSAHALVGNGGIQFLCGERGNGDTWTGNPLPRLWGKGLQGHMYFFSGTSLHFEQRQNGDVFAPPALPTLENYLGAGGTIIEVGANVGNILPTKSNVFNPATGTWGLPVDNTWANFDVAMPAGFKNAAEEFQDAGPWGAFRSSMATACRPDWGIDLSFTHARYELPPGEFNPLVLTPDTGAAAGGTAISIAGSNFRVGCTVEFDGVAAGAVVRVDDTTITCTSPAHAIGPVAVKVTNPSGAYAEIEFTYV